MTATKEGRTVFIEEKAPAPRRTRRRVTIPGELLEDLPVEPTDVPVGTLALDRSDPFAATLARIWDMHVKKGADYALDADEFSNFRDTAFILGLPGFSAEESALFNIIQKVVRLKSLRTNGRMADVSNEAVSDTYLDLAVYAAILYTLSQE